MQHSGAILATCAKLHLSAQMMRHQLHSIPRTEYRSSEGRDVWVEMWCALVANTRAAAGATEPDQRPCDHEQDRHALHLLILGTKRSNAIADCRNQTGEMLKS